VAPGKVTVALAKGQLSMTLPLLAKVLDAEERRASVGLAVQETLVVMVAAVTAHLPTVMTSHHALLHREDQGDRLATLGTLVLVLSPV